MVNKKMVYKKMAQSLLILMVMELFIGVMPTCSNHQVYSSDPLIVGDNPVDEIFEIDSKTEFYHTGGIMVTGRGVLVVKGTLYQTGNVYITGNGTLRVDGGKFHIDGHDTNVYVDNYGSCIFNNALLHYVQDYVSQHNLIGVNNGQFVFRNSWVDCDGSIEFVHLVDNALYDAVDTHFTDWTTWYLYDQTVLSLENVNYAGDIVIYDSPTLRFKNTNMVMPWLYFAEGAVIDYVFPEEKTVTITIDNTVKGISGIPWTLTMENCSYVAWGVNPYPGSDITVRNSQLTMALFRFAGEGEFNLKGIMRNNSYYKDETIPVTDRHFRLVNTSVKWWKVDVIDDFQLKADSIVFSEMVLKNNSRAHLTHSICEGQTIHLGAKDNAFLYFEKGEVWSFVSVWENAVMVLSDSVVDWEKGKFIYQRCNIAHGNSRLYCLNSVLKSKPEAYDSALVMFASITGPDHGRIGDSIPIFGSAWIDTGPESGVAFLQYQLAWAKNGIDWTVIAESFDPVEDGILGAWDTSGFKEGKYNLRLQIQVAGDDSDHPTDSYPLYKVVILTSNGPNRLTCGWRGKIQQV